jgi:hypothetical protein
MRWPRHKEFFISGSLLKQDAEEKSLQMRVLDPRKYVQIEP